MRSDFSLHALLHKTTRKIPLESIVYYSSSSFCWTGENENENEGGVYSILRLTSWRNQSDKFKEKSERI